jgi:hypothetical protein
VDAFKTFSTIDTTDNKYNKLQQLNNLLGKQKKCAATQAAYQWWTNILY